MVGHYIDNHFHALRMSTRNQGFKFLQAVSRVYGEIGINVVIIFHGVRRTGATLHHIGIVIADAVSSVIANDRMMRHAGVPYMSYAQFFDRFKRSLINIIKFSNTIFFNRAPGFIGAIGVAVEAGENLVDDRLGLRRRDRFKANRYTATGAKIKLKLILGSNNFLFNHQIVRIGFPFCIGAVTVNLRFVVFIGFEKI